jgi:hypothetical protein
MSLGPQAFRPAWLLSRSDTRDMLSAGNVAWALLAGMELRRVRPGIEIQHTWLCLSYTDRPA